MSFDPLVVAAMARWPQVPAVYGWLRLDRRGGWHLIDRGRPGFDEALHGLGSPITSPPILDFIARNYAHDPQGRWFWQNGPQRVFVDLDAAPWVLRVLSGGPDATLITHTGQHFGPVTGAALDPTGGLLLDSAQGCGIVHDLDAGELTLHEDEAGRLRLQLGGCLRALEICADPAARFGFCRQPRPAG